MTIPFSPPPDDQTPIDPAFVLRAKAHLEQTGAPLLEYRLPEYEFVLQAADPFGMGVYELSDPSAPEEPPYVTWREYARYAGLPETQVMDEWHLGAAELDQEMDPDAAIQLWPLAETPSGAAYEMLVQIPLGQRFVSGGETLGEIRLVTDPESIGDYLGVQLSSLLAISCLQYVLDELGAGIKIIFRA